MLSAEDVIIAFEQRWTKVKSRNSPYQICVNVLEKTTGLTEYTLEENGLVDFLHEYAHLYINLQYMKEHDLPSDTIEHFEADLEDAKLAFIRRYNAEYFISEYCIERVH